MRRTLTVCALLLIVLLAMLLMASVIGSQRLPVLSVLCALSGRSTCGLSSEGQAILFTSDSLAFCSREQLECVSPPPARLIRRCSETHWLNHICWAFPNGAAVGTMIALVFLGAHELSRPVLAFAGALAATFIVYRLARGRAGATPERLILAGVIVTTFLSSGIVFITTLMDATRIRSFTFWLLGDLSGTTTSLLTVVFVAAAIGVVVLSMNARSLNLMMLGERDAFDLGVEVQRVRLTVFIAASLLVGASVAASGSVGYVGLIVPHLTRLSFGSDNRIVIPASALAGAAFVILADTIARTLIAPRELPVGAITALIGAPLFVYLLRRG